MSGSIEELTFEERLIRLAQMADALITIIRGGVVAVFEALQKAADLLGVAYAQMKYGLSYARTNGLVVFDDRTAQLSLVA
jgi:hypothetical protein